MASVTWTQDANSNYEISSVNHLLQLMHGGTLFTNAGSPPASYLTVNYIQTVDIDLASESASIVPIGNFNGIYDGQGYRISNWSYDAANSGAGLFLGASGTGASLRNMVLDGVWILLNGNNSGFLSGSTNNGCHVYNITTNFDAGTRIVGYPLSGSTGIVVGVAPKSTFSNITVGGTIDEFSGGGATGGIIGHSNGIAPSPWSYLRNIATFTTGIDSRSSVGGIVGVMEHQCSYIMNAMTGDIRGTISETGGVFGRTRADASDVAVCMRGNITTASGQTAAGIAGRVDSFNSFTRAVNYMTGDVECGLFAAVGAATVDKCVVAMRGTTTYAALLSTTGTSDILLNTSYGSVSQFTNNTVTTMDVSSFDEVNEDGLPFFSFNSTDTIGNVIDWEFIFSNFPLFALTARPLSIDVTFVSVVDAVAYTLTIQETGGSIVTVDTGFTSNSISANSLTPETEYTLRLFSTDDNIIYTIRYEESTTTLVNVATNYDSSNFINDNGIFDISILDQDSFSLLGEVINEVFSTGDILVVPLQNGKTQKSTFVRDGDTFTVVDEESIIFPFNDDTVEIQSAQLTLKDSTTLTVVYDGSNSTFTVGGVTYPPGSSAIVDGKKMTVLEI